MAEALISPGVLARENDNSFISQGPIRNSAAIIGPTVKGPVEWPQIVTSYSDFTNKFGSTFIFNNGTGSGNVQGFFTSIAAYNFFANGGETLLVTRVASGSYAPATSSFISGSTAGAIASGSAFTLTTFSEGTIMNSTSPIDISGSLASGSVDNIRFQIANSNTSSGTFDVYIRQGNDNTANPIILETWTGLSLDPTAPNFISRVIGDSYQALDTVNNQMVSYGVYKNNSRYVYVSSINPYFLMPNYFDNNGNANAAYAPYMPANVPVSGTFGAATGTITSSALFYENISGVNTQGLVANNYTNSIALLANQDDYQFNVLVTPGLFGSNANYNALQTTIINNTQNRGDNIYVVDLVPYSSSVDTVTSQAQSRNTSYAAAYWPWVQTIDPDSGQFVWVPASTMIPGVYAYNDTVSEPWFAPAGINRGGLTQVIRAERKLTQTQRDNLYTGNVNPIATFPATGVVVYGQKTLQKKASALDRVNVRRLLIALKNYISEVAQNLVFEQNTIATRNAFLAAVNPYLETVQQKQGLYAFKVIMDDSNNPAEVIDRNQMVGQIYIQPTKTAEFIYLDFNILPTGATFPA
jgi:phage tail sheath protein FI